MARSRFHVVIGDHLLLADGTFAPRERCVRQPELPVATFSTYRQAMTAARRVRRSGAEVEPIAGRPKEE